MINEFPDWHETAICLHLHAISISFDMDKSRAKYVCALALTHEGELEFSFVRIGVQILAQLRINRISLVWNINVEAGCHILHVSLECLDFMFVITHFLKQLDASLVGLVVFILELNYVVCGGLNLFLQRLSFIKHCLVLSFEFVDLLQK